MSIISSGTLHVLTYKDGILSRLGHDLQLSVQRFDIQVDGAHVSGRFYTGSLRVDTALVGGRSAPDALSARDRREIEDAARKKVLRVSAYPEARFEGDIESDDGSTVRLTGNLELVGRRAPVSLEAARRDGRVRGGVSLKPTIWGIAPFKALLGALRLQDRVDVRFDLADPK